MSEEEQLDEKIANTVIKIGSWSFTPAKLMIMLGIVTSTLGGLYGAFEVYKDYMDMKEKIQSYEAPDLSEFDKRLAVIEENSSKTTDYTRDIKNDLKSDIRRNESVTEQIERSVKTAQREIDQEIRGLRTDIRSDLDKVRAEMSAVRQEMTQQRRETEQEITKLRKEVDNKIQKAIDNPLANK